MTKKRIWEVDALRGLCLLFVFVSHLVFDFEDFLHIQLPIGGFLKALFHYGGAVFVVISGLSATLGSRSFRRGVIVFSCGMLITLVTVVMIRLGYLPKGNIILFGVLHLLGVCMMLYPALKKLPTALLVSFGLLFVAVGYWFTTFTLSAGTTEGFDLRSLLSVVGLCLPDYCAGDYFPLLPHLGWFMLGIALGRTLYRGKRTRFPRFPADSWPVRALRFIGRHSLLFYLLHQPVFFAAFQIYSSIRSL